MWLIALSVLVLVDAGISRQENTRTKARAAIAGLLFQPVAVCLFVSSGDYFGLVLCAGYAFFWADEAYCYWFERSL